MRKYLYLVLIFKALILFVFSSDYSLKLFYPFVLTFLEHSLNPWQYYFETNLSLDAFPYHSFMLYILYPFAKLSNILSLSGVFKLPLLFADIIIFITLLKMFPTREKNIFIYYFLNPIVIYAIYIHSQLDIIPTSLFLLSIYFLIRKQYTYSALFIGLSLSTKMHIIIALPILLFYIYKTLNLPKTFQYLMVVCATLVLLDMPFLFSDGFIQMVLLNPKQSLLFDSFYSIGKLKLLLPVASIFLVYFHFLNQNKINQDLLFFYFGMLFTSVILFIYPAPAWYIWMLPFMTIYFINSHNQKKSLLLYVGFSGIYILFFLFFYKSEYAEIIFTSRVIDVKIDSEKLRDIVFTTLEVFLLAIMYTFYKYGIKSNSVYKKNKNLAIGIGGDSGTGKTTLLKSLENLFRENILQIEGDGEHKWERGDANWTKVTHLNPKANHIHKQANAIFALKNNETIYRSDYDHESGKFTVPKKVIPKKYIMIAGLHPFYLPTMRKNIDLKIYLDTDEELRRYWKIQRDVQKRGYSISKIESQIQSRIEDAKKYIYPQKKFADFLIRYFSVSKINFKEEVQEINLGVKIILDASIHLEYILQNLNCDFIWDYNDDLKTQFLELKEQPDIDYKQVAFEYIENIDEIIDNDATWQNGYDGLIQLILLKIISEKLKEESF